MENGRNNSCVVASETVNKAKPVWRILVVDNEALVCETIQKLLQLDGHFVQTVTSGRQALLLLEKAKFDLVTTDHSMSRIEDVNLPAAIKQRLPDQPVLMISTNGAIAKDGGDPLPGVDEVIGKPFTRDELRAVLAKILSGT